MAHPVPPTSATATVMLLSGAFLALPSGPSEAQTVPAAPLPSDTFGVEIAAPPDGPGRVRDASPEAALVGGVVGGGAGIAVGALVGGSGDCYELCFGIFMGAVIGEVVGVALGTHAFNRGRGSFFADLGVSAAVGGLGIAVGSAVGRAESGILLGTAMAQVAAVALTEVRTSPWIEPTADVRATPDGWATEVGFRIRWDRGSGPAQ